MLLLKRFRAWLARKKPPQCLNPEIPPGLEADVGVRVTRIRLPSGVEVVIVERVKEKG